MKSAKKIIYFLILSFIFCSWNFFNYSEPKKAKKIGLEVAKIIEKKYVLSLVSEGESGYPKYRHIALGFKGCSVPLTVDNVRRLIVPIMEEILNYMNAHPEIAEEFINFPLTYENVMISLVFTTNNREQIYHPFIWGITNIGNKLFYFSEVYHPPQPGVYGRDKREHEETFEEAKAILEKEKQANEISSKPLTDANEILPLEKPSP